MTTTINHSPCVCHLLGLLSAHEFHDGLCSSWLWRDLWYHARYFLTGNEARTKTGRRKFLLCSVVRCAVTGVPVYTQRTAPTNVSGKH